MHSSVRVHLNAILLDSIGRKRVASSHVLKRVFMLSLVLGCTGCGLLRWKHKHNIVIDGLIPVAPDRHWPELLRIMSNDLATCSSITFVLTSKSPIQPVLAERCTFSNSTLKWYPRRSLSLGFMSQLWFQKGCDFITYRSSSKLPTSYRPLFSHSWNHIVVLTESGPPSSSGRRDSRIFDFLYSVKNTVWK
jgi:hypothetical protein